MTPAQVRERFRQVVARGIAKADQAHAEHLAAIRATREPSRGPVHPREVMGRKGRGR